MKIRTNPVFNSKDPYVAMGVYWRELANTVNKHEDGIIAVEAPASASSQGTPGQVAYDSTHVYVCVAQDTWKRASLSTW